MENIANRLKIIFHNDSLVLHKYKDSFEGSFSIYPTHKSGYWSAWRNGHLAFGGLLGKTICFSLKKNLLNSLEIG